MLTCTLLILRLLLRLHLYSKFKLMLAMGHLLQRAWTYTLALHAPQIRLLPLLIFLCSTCLGRF